MGGGGGGIGKITFSNPIVFQQNSMVVTVHLCITLDADDVALHAARVPLLKATNYQIHR